MNARIEAFSSVSTALALCSDRELAALVDAAKPIGAGIGGPTALLEVDGNKVFVKRLPLTDRDLRPGDAHSTANLFDLPTFCHHPVAGPGFGAWRELAVHTMTTNWVLTGEYEVFPLTYHWRVLPHHGQSLPEELADIDAVVAKWGGGPEIRARLEGVRDSTASVAVFLEYFPHNLHNWLGERIEARDEEAERLCVRIEQQILEGTRFMNDRGLLHFDAHFENLLTDGERLYFADYGLAISDRFDLAEDEAAFLAEHQDYDYRYSLTHLTIWLVTALYGHRGEERMAFLRACVQGERPTGIPTRIADIIVRYAPIALVNCEFYRQMAQQSTQTPYPAMP
ncbi:hypothetical protein [Actinospica robiniae]|uniref:hypothetical protein n=1 Tax=Actinospica robiniae TaxID=304901 RepID=UPI0004163793|nr:hypothetical protein [Actinospica robiniae]